MAVTMIVNRHFWCSRPVVLLDQCAEHFDIWIAFLCHELQPFTTVRFWTIRYMLYSVSQKSSPPKTFCGIFSPSEPV